MLLQGKLPLAQYSLSGGSTQLSHHHGSLCRAAKNRTSGFLNNLLFSSPPTSWVRGYVCTDLWYRLLVQTLDPVTRSWCC